MRLGEMKDEGDTCQGSGSRYWAALSEGQRGPFGVVEKYLLKGGLDVA